MHIDPKQENDLLLTHPWFPKKTWIKFWRKLQFKSYLRLSFYIYFPRFSLETKLNPTKSKM